MELGGRMIASAADFRAAVLAAKNPIEAVIERAGSTEPLKPVIELAGNPVRLGIFWRLDDAEPGALIVNRIVPGSPADVAGVKVNDRLYEAGGLAVTTTEDFQKLVASTAGQLELLVETAGQPRRVVMELPAAE